MRNKFKHLGFLFLLVTVITACNKLNNEFHEQENYELNETRTTNPDATEYYWLDNEKIPIQKMDNKFYVMFQSANEESIKKELAKSNISLIKECDQHSIHG